MLYSEAIYLVLDEHARSVRMHGTWEDYSIEQMMSVIINELLMEAGAAEAAGDILGPHGVIRELAQVAACSIKAMVVLSNRYPKETLAETLRTAGAHSEVEGCDLPASPSLHQGKESCSNHPEEVTQI